MQTTKKICFATLALAVLLTWTAPAGAGEPLADGALEPAIAEVEETAEACASAIVTIPGVDAPLDRAIATSDCSTEPSCHDLHGEPCSPNRSTRQCEVYPEGGCGVCDCMWGSWMCTL